MVFSKYNNSNNAKSTLKSLIWASALSLICKTWEWALYPATNFKLTIEQYNSDSIVVKREIVYCSSRTWDTFTIVRSQWTCVWDDSADPKVQWTTAYSFEAWDRIGQYMTNEDIDDIQDELTRIVDVALPLKANIEDIQNGTYVYWASSWWTDDYAITTTPAISAYAVSQSFRFQADVANTWAATLNVCGKWAIDIKKWHDLPLDDWDIEANQIVTVSYDWTNFQMDSQVATIANIAIHSQSEKEVIVDADEFVIADSADSRGNKKVTKSNLLLNKFTLWETITATNPVALRTDWNIYDFTWQSDAGAGFSSTTMNIVRSVMIDTDTIVVIYRNTSSTYGVKMIAWTIVWDVITYGSAIDVDLTSSNNTNVSICKINDGAWVILYNDATNIQWAPFTVSWNTVTLWSPVTINWAANVWASCEVCQIDTNKVAFSYGSWAANLEATVRAWTISANVLTIWSEKILSWWATTFNRLCKLDTNKFVASYIYSWTLSVKACTVSWTTITEWSAEDIETTSPDSVYLYQVDTDIAIITYDDGTDALLKYITFSWTASTAQAENTIFAWTTMSPIQKWLF